MELLYLWIEDYKNIYRQGFNFSPLYEFEFKPTKEENGKVIEGTLTDNITEKESKRDFYNGFFGDGITNVTAIVGENGAGKSSVLDFIRLLIAHDNNRKSFVMVTRENFNIQIYHDLKKISRDLKNTYTKDRIIDNVLNLSDSIGKLTLFYHSELRNDCVITDFGNDYGVKDISTSNYIHSESLPIIHRDKMDEYYLEEYKRQIIFASFINQSLSKTDKFPINIPNQVAMTLVGTYGRYAYAVIAKDNNFPTPFSHKDIDNHTYRRFSSIPSFIQSIYDVFWAVLITRLYAVENSKVQTVHLSLSFEEIKEKLLHKMTKNANTEDLLNDIFNDSTMNSNEESSLLKKENYDVLQKIVKHIQSLDTAFIIEDKSPHLFLSLSETIDLINLGLNIFSFRWVKNGHFLHLSQGEQILLSFFGRCYSVEAGRSYVLSCNFIFFIDEGELGLHPQWQKQYLKILLETLPKIFPNKQIQLILTSHSPFLVSDLPKENVIFLRKGKEGEKLENGEDAEGKCIVEKNSFQEQTFGQNIHMLFANSFFLEKNGGLMGEFAKEKISKVIDFINDKPNDVVNSNEIAQKYIDLIGEPILQRQLQKKLYEKQLKGKQQNEKITLLRKMLKDLEE
ncbi:AAA family ATPase [Bernardetia sp. MNP-M8]|uniref:AAA family ATPase n=1 Tax=Bernardetia sp. MNP-M8 TaxID=3127470 RepID=UPI0030CDF467